MENDYDTEICWKYMVFVVVRVPAEAFEILSG
jgi:hypothetical protein